MSCDSRCGPLQRLLINVQYAAISQSYSWANLYRSRYRCSPISERFQCWARFLNFAFPSYPMPLRVYQLAFLTPGIDPAKAFTRKLYCEHNICQHLTHECIHSLKSAARRIQDPRTLDILKSLNIPLPFPPSIQRFLICVGRV